MKKFNSILKLVIHRDEVDQIFKISVAENTSLASSETTFPRVTPLGLILLCKRARDPVDR